MAAHVIVLANRTAAAPELIEALVHRSERGPIHATLVMPAAGPGSADRAVATERMNAAIEAWKAAGIERCEGVVCDPIPLEALTEVWDPMRHDEVIVSTLPGQSSSGFLSDCRLGRAVHGRVGAARGRTGPGRPPRDVAGAGARGGRARRSACWRGAGGARRQFGAHEGFLARRTRDLQQSIQRGDAVRDPRRPLPAPGSAPPMPSSRTSITTLPLAWRTDTSADVASAYFDTFVSASEITK